MLRPMTILVLTQKAPASTVFTINVVCFYRPTDTTYELDIILIYSVSSLHKLHRKSDFSIFAESFVRSKARDLDNVTFQSRSFMYFMIVIDCC